MYRLEHSNEEEDIKCPDCGERVDECSCEYDEDEFDEAIGDGFYEDPEAA